MPVYFFEWGSKYVELILVGRFVYISVRMGKSKLFTNQVSSEIMETHLRLCDENLTSLSLDPILG